MVNPTEKGAVILAQSKGEQITIEAPDEIPWVTALLRQMGSKG